jgi:hypothetical protein
MGMVCYEVDYRKKENKKESQSNKKDEYKSIKKENSHKIDKIEISTKQKEQNKSNSKLKDKDINEIDKYTNNNNLEKIYNTILKIHNDIRQKNKHEEIKLNDKLTQIAQKTADNFDILEESNFQIENYNNKPLGINYEKFNENNLKIKDICEKWIKEGNKKQIKNFSKIKHFTQIIWKNTEEIGIGYSELNNKEKILVILYYPAGNIFEEFDNNIPKDIFLEEKDKPELGEN